MRRYMMELVPLIYGASFVFVGLRHFQDPAWFEPIVPKELGNPRFWVYLSGIFEIILGIGMILPYFRPEASILIAMMLVVLYWANLNMWVNDIPIGGSTLTTKGHILRALAQVFLIWMALDRRLAAIEGIDRGRLTVRLV